MDSCALAQLQALIPRRQILKPNQSKTLTDFGASRWSWQQCHECVQLGTHAEPHIPIACWMVTM